MRQRHRGAYSDEWPQIAKRVKAASGYACVRCGIPSQPGHILTVHHLDCDKDNMSWWNLAALCQACHLSIQGRVVLDRPWLLEHSEWFRPYVAGYYAKTNGLPDDREYVKAHTDELLAIGQGRAMEDSAA